MIAQQMTFECPECGWSKCVDVGDVNPEFKMIKYLKCPKCGIENKKRAGCDSPLDGIMGKLKDIFKA